MRLTFDEWYKIWLDSGHWAERGREKGQYCMSRFGDLGHYELGNVFIQLTSHNVSEGQAGKPKSKITCPHCQKVGGNTGFMYKFHFDNCPRVTP